MEDSRGVYVSTSIFSFPVLRIVLIVGLLYFLKVEQKLISIFILIFIIIIELSALMARIGLRKLHSNRRLSSSRIFPEDQAQVNITIENAKCLPALLSWVQEMPSSLRTVSNAGKTEDESTICGKVSIEKYGREDICIKFTALKRGCYKIPDLRLQSRDLFGLFVRDSYNNDPLTLIVYPKLLDLNEINLSPADFSGLKRNDRPFLFDPIMFVGVREYTPGIPARLIDWKASAHQDILLSKIVESSSNLKILIAVDTNSIMSMADMKNTEDLFEEALSVAASIAVWADDNKIPFGFIADFMRYDQEGVAIIPVSRTYNQGMFVLEALARAEYKTSGSLEDILNIETRYIPWGTTLIVIGNNSIGPLNSAIRQVICYPLTGSSSVANIKEARIHAEEKSQEPQGDTDHERP